MIDNTALKACPFCGGGATLSRHEFFAASPPCGVKCLGCGVASDQFYETEAEAIAAWNRRKPEPEGGAR